MGTLHGLNGILLCTAIAFDPYDSRHEARPGVEVAGGPGVTRTVDWLFLEIFGSNSRKMWPIPPRIDGQHMLHQPWRSWRPKEVTIADLWAGDTRQAVAEIAGQKVIDFVTEVGCVLVYGS